MYNNQPSFLDKKRLQRFKPSQYYTDPTLL
jgi:hypothetical protein